MSYHPMGWKPILYNTSVLDTFTTSQALVEDCNVVYSSLENVSLYRRSAYIVSATMQVNVQPLPKYRVHVDDIIPPDGLEVNLYTIHQFLYNTSFTASQAVAEDRNVVAERGPDRVDDKQRRHEHEDGVRPGHHTPGHH